MACMIVAMGDDSQRLDASSGARWTRRSLLQAGAGVTLAALGASAGVLEQSASATEDSELGPELIHAGELRLFAASFAPKGWHLCNGAVEGAPDLRGRGAVGDGRPPSGPDYRVGEHGKGIADRRRDSHPATLTLTYLVSLEPRFAEPMYGEIRPFPFESAPSGWIVCDGRELEIAPNTALYSLIGNGFGGQYKRTFRVPDLRGRTPLSWGPAPGVEPEPVGAIRDDLAPAGQGRRPRLHVTYCIANSGTYPTRS
jgi:microcystin-dependent protein